MQASLYSLLALMQMRILVLFNRNRRIYFILVISFVVSWTASFILLVLSTLKTQFIYVPSIGTCLLDDPPNVLRYMFVTSFLLEFASFTIFGIKASLHLTSGAPADSLITQVCLDGLRYCFGLFCVRVFNLLVWLTAPPDLLFLSIFIFWAATVISVNHILLQIRNNLRQKVTIPSSMAPPDFAMWLNSPSPRPRPDDYCDTELSDVSHAANENVDTAKIWA